MTDEQLISWIDRGQLAAALLVAVGVAGEFILQFAARPVNRRIEFARELQMSQQHERTANAERALAELQEKLKDRTLNDEQRGRLAEALTLGAPRCPIELLTAVGDGEAQRFANLLAEILVNGGWTDVTTVTSNVDYPDRGIAIGPNTKTTNACFNIVFNAFRSLGLKPSLVDNPDAAEGTLVIHVGRKPD